MTFFAGPMTSNRLRPLSFLADPLLLAFLPALILGAYWIGGERALLLSALGAPLIVAVRLALRPPGTLPPRDLVTGFLLEGGFDAALRDLYADTGGSGLRSACFALELGGLSDLRALHGEAAVDLALARSGERILSALREGDLVARLGDNRFAIALMPVHQLDLELCINLAGRLQAAVEEAIALDGCSIHLSCSIGFCLRSRAPRGDAGDWFDAATAALEEARHGGDSAIRAYSPDIQRSTRLRHDMQDEVLHALMNGQILAWFQPQVSTDTGHITGFEALARWQHPLRGMIAPDRFLPVLLETGQIERLGHMMLRHALVALRGWDRAGLNIARVGVNFTSRELRNPDLADRIAWELDRFDLAPDRLAVEIVETVASYAPDEVVIRNIARLAELGCAIDLDDFGTGHASIASIRRLAISRIKIDRSFVSRIDRDSGQRRLVAAILSMAQQLELETLAEGVETPGEHALLAQMGCDHVQGFGIGRPMPFEQTFDWIAAHERSIIAVPAIGNMAGPAPRGPDPFRAAPP